MPRKPPPRASAERVHELFLASTESRRASKAADEVLYRAAYQANQEGWSGRALGKAIGVHRRTVEDWIRHGRQRSKE